MNPLRDQGSCVSEEKIRPNTIPVMTGFDALQEALKPLVELVRFISKPETGTVIRHALEDLEGHWREEDQSFINFTVTKQFTGQPRRDLPRSINQPSSSSDIRGCYRV
jgi:hypothetical protein